MTVTMTSQGKCAISFADKGDTWPLLIVADPSEMSITVNGETARMSVEAWHALAMNLKAQLQEKTDARKVT